ncbi:uncharacterized protein LOC131630037 [Vicia villosa]|uniref:uncharacterized protein LOC131630037 n=1 Tax=Vicia villosa TaxID=3911 RepID=UPI00273B4DEA|nr:uncharacterized protein LOC131630037 [Vicia villosa]
MDGVIGEELFELLEILKDISPFLDRMDSVVWWRDVDGYSVKNCFKRLYSLKFPINIPNNKKLFELQRLWKALVPCKVKLFGWRFLLGALPTRQELGNRGITLSTSGLLCPLCGIEVETMEHLFLGCPKVKIIWMRVFRWLEVDFEARFSLITNVDNVSGEELLDFISGVLVREFNMGYFAFIWLLVCWCVWISRNNLVFNNVVWNELDIFSFITSLGWDWFSILAKGNDDLSKDIWLSKPSMYLDL